MDRGFVADPYDAHDTVDGDGSLAFKWNEHVLTSFFISVTHLLYQTCDEEEQQ